MEGDYSDREAERILAQVADWGGEFAQSPRFGELSEEQRGNADFVIEMFAEHMYSYFLLQPEKWNPADLEECCLGLLPRKLRADAGFYRSIAPVLAAFFVFLGERGLIRNAESLMNWTTICLSAMKMTSSSRYPSPKPSRRKSAGTSPAPAAAERSTRWVS